MRPLKIALFSDSALPVLNGVSVSIDALVHSFRERGHSVFLYTSKYSGHKDSDPNVTRFPAIWTPWTKDYPLAIPPFYPWFHEFQRREFDVVHTHTPFTVGFVGLRWAQSCEIPVVSTYHTLYDKYIHYVPFFPKRYLRYKMAKHTNFYYNSVDHVVTPSDSSYRWLARHSVKKPISVIPTGIPEPRSFNRDEVRREFGVAPHRKILLYTGRVAQEKNLTTLLEAASLVFKSDPETEFWIVGDGPASTDLKSLARAMGVGDRLRFWGFVPRKDLDRFYAAADMFLFASTTETQGLVILEAMSYGLPVIVVQGGGASASVDNGRNGFIVPNDPAEIADRAVKLLKDNALYKSVSSHAVELAMSMTVNAMADRVLKVYEGVLGISQSQELRLAK